MAREALALWAEHPLAELRLAQACSRQGKQRTAITACDRGLAFVPDSPALLLTRGDAKSKLRDVEGALTDYGRALQLEPEFVVALNNRGALLARQKRFGEALRDYDRLLELDGFSTDGYLNRGVIHDLSGRARQAWLDYETVLFLDRDHQELAKLKQLSSRVKRSLSRAQRRKLSAELQARREHLLAISDTPGFAVWQAQVRRERQDQEMTVEFSGGHPLVSKRAEEDRREGVMGLDASESDAVPPSLGLR